MLQIVYFTLDAKVDGVELTVTHAYLVRDAVSLQQKDIFRSLLLLGTNFSHVIVLVVLIIIKIFFPKLAYKYNFCSHYKYPLIMQW